MNYNVDPELIINNLLDKNKSQTFHISVLESAITQLQNELKVVKASIEDSGLMEA